MTQFLVNEKVQPELDGLPWEIVLDKTMQHHDTLQKLIIIGDTGVGKSCILARGIDNEFKEEHNVTIGVEFGSYVVRVENRIVKLQIWDTVGEILKNQAGQEQFRSITRIFYRGANAVFLTYDITRKSSFANLEDWLKEIRQNSNPDIIIYLIGNQIDNEEEREVTSEQGIDFAKEHRLEAFFQTSAKSGANITELFVMTAKRLHLQSLEKQASTPSPSAENDSYNDTKVGPSQLTNPKQKSGGCC